MAKTIITITGEIDTDKVPTLQEQYLKERPIPTDDDGAPLYTFMQWFKKDIWRYVIGECKQGKKKLDAEAAEEIVIE